MNITAIIDLITSAGDSVDDVLHVNVTDLPIALENIKMLSLAHGVSEQRTPTLIPARKPYSYSNYRIHLFLVLIFAYDSRLAIKTNKKNPRDKHIFGNDKMLKMIPADLHHKLIHLT